MKILVNIAVIALPALVGGCVSYQARPLDGRAELAALNARTIPDAVLVRGGPDAAGQPGAVFDAGDGLSEEEAVGVALTLNTDLAAARAGIGESEALLIGARVYPNPEIGVGLRPGIAGTKGFGADADLLFDLLRPGVRSARLGVATARADAARAAVLAEEYAVAAAVRRQVLAVLAAEHGATLLSEEASLSARLVELIRERRGLGESNDLDVTSVELELAELRRDERLAGIQVERARLELNRLLGLPPAYAVRLTRSGQPLRVVVPADVSDDELTAQLLSGRLDLRAKEAEYRVTEEELRVAVSGQYPGLKIGPSFQHDGTSENYLGVGVSLELPIFDRNQGGIAEKEAARARVGAEYAVLLHRLNAEAFGARAAVRAAKSELEAEERDLLPLLQRRRDLARAAFEARELNVLDWTAIQQRSLRTRRAYLDSVVAYQEAVIALDAATGRSLGRSTATGEKASSETPSPDSTGVVPARSTP